MIDSMNIMKKAVSIFFIFLFIFTFAFQCHLLISDPDIYSKINNSPDPFKDILYRDMALLPTGTYFQYDQGSYFEHRVSGFRIAKYETTYELWRIVYQWAKSHGYTFANPGREGNDGTDDASPTTAKYEPVTNISWRDAIVWCNAYSEMASLNPCYTYGGGIIKNSSNATSCNNAVCSWTANGYRLPTEGEWKFSASYIDGTNWLSYDYASGNSLPFSDSSTANYAWYITNSGNITHNVGTKLGNISNIFDLSGNVSEWCWDWYGSYPTPSPMQIDYRGPSSGLNRVFLNGSWHDTSTFMQICYRSDNPSDTISDYTGFRVARTY